MNVEQLDREAAIKSLAEENWRNESSETEAELLRLRVDQGRILCDGTADNGVPPVFSTDVFAGQAGIPEIDASELNGAALASGILHHGGLLVRGLYRPKHMAQLRALAATQEVANKGDNAPLACTPHTLFHLLEVYRESGLLQAIREYMGTDPVLLAERTKLRHYRVEVDAYAAIPWHQDVNFFGSRTYAVNCWAAVSSCGDGNPGLGFIPFGTKERIGWNKEDGLAPLNYANNIPKSVFEALMEKTPAAYPIMRPGDALLFDEMTVHRTASKAWEMDEQIVTIGWFSAPPASPSGGRHLPCDAMKELSVVIPVFNEAPILVNTIDTIVDALRDIKELESFELVVVDDGSTDGSWQLLAQELCPRYPQIHAIKLSRNFGKESALSAGLEQANGGAVIVMDADLQHPPAIISEMFAIWKRGGTDVVEAIKRTRGDETLGSQVSAESFYAVFSRLSGLDLKNASDFKLMDKRVVNAWKELPERNLFFRGMSAWVGFNREQVLFDVAERAGSDTKWSRLKLIKLALTSIAAFSSAPLHLITFAGILFSIFSLFLGISTLYQYATGVAVSGFTTVILLLLIIGGAIMIALGIIGEYLARIYDEVKGRPRYFVSESISSAPGSNSDK